MEFNDSASRVRDKMHEMKKFMNNLINDSTESDSDDDTKLTKAELDELVGGLSE